MADPEANGQATGMQKQASMVNEEDLLRDKEEELKKLEQELEESKSRHPSYSLSVLSITNFLSFSSLFL